jgi:hypothetical protein
MKKLLITVGKPASGKSYFTKGYLEANNQLWGSQRRPTDFVDLDYYMNHYTYKKIEDVQERLQKVLNQRINYDYDDFIIDGLLMSTESVLKILSNIKSSKIKAVEIHYWEEDIEACLWNDRYRRESDSVSTIKNATLQKIDIDKIKQQITGIDDIKLVIHNVIRKPDWKMFADKYKISMNRTMCLESSTWCMGGVGRNYTGDEWTVHPDSPVEFTELDKLLEKVCPLIGFLQYKRILNECVEENVRDAGDYYSSIDNGYFECDIEKLYDLLSEMGIAGYFEFDDQGDC